MAFRPIYLVYRALLRRATTFVPETPIDPTTEPPTPCRRGLRRAMRLVLPVADVDAPVRAFVPPPLRVRVLRAPVAPCRVPAPATGRRGLLVPAGRATPPFRLFGGALDTGAAAGRCGGAPAVRDDDDGSRRAADSAFPAAVPRPGARLPARAGRTGDGVAAMTLASSGFFLQAVNTCICSASKSACRLPQCGHKCSPVPAPAPAPAPPAMPPPNAPREP